MNRIFGFAIVSGMLAAFGVAQTPPKKAAPKTAAPAAAAKGDAASGQKLFEQNCALCHSATTNDVMMGPALKGVYKLPKMTSSGKPVTDANLLDKINKGGNGMPPFEDSLKSADKADVLAYLHTL